MILFLREYYGININSTSNFCEFYFDSFFNYNSSDNFNLISMELELVVILEVEFKRIINNTVNDWTAFDKIMIIAAVENLQKRRKG